MVFKWQMCWEIFVVLPVRFLTPTYGCAWEPQREVLSSRTVISCWRQRDRHRSTGMCLFEEKTRVNQLETHEGRNCVTPWICYSWTCVTYVSEENSPSVKEPIVLDDGLLLGVDRGSFCFLLTRIHLFFSREGGGDSCKQRSPGYPHLLKYIWDYWKRSP